MPKSALSLEISQIQSCSLFRTEEPFFSMLLVMSTEASCLELPLHCMPRKLYCLNPKFDEVQLRLIC